MVSTARAVPSRLVVRQVQIPLSTVHVRADLALPAEARGLVIFVHGSGSGRRSPRNRYVADVLNKYKLATLLVDLLTDDEERADQEHAHLRFDIRFLADRLGAISEWAWHQPELHALDCAYFGSSSGAAAALIAAAGAYRIRAIVARGGRADLAGALLPCINAPVLLLVGARDREVLKLNERALRALNGASRLEVVPRASHLFEEAGALEMVAQRTAAWFGEHLG